MKVELSQLSDPEVRGIALRAAAALHGPVIDLIAVQGDNALRERGRAVGSVLHVAGIFETWIREGRLIPSPTSPVEVSVNGQADWQAVEVARRKAAGRGPR